MNDASLADLARRLSSVRGVVALVLGGSRARGTIGMAATRCTA